MNSPSPTPRLVRRRLSVLAFLLLLVGAAGCGSGGGGLTGTWSDEMDLVSYEFDRDGTVTVTSLGGSVLLSWERDGDRILVGEPGQQQVLRLEDGVLQAGFGALHRRDES
jgi:hypothetical protein